MRSLFLLATALVMLVVASAPAAAQKRSDFSGTWVEDESQRKSPYEKTPPAAGMKAISGPPPAVVITQTPEQITIERTFMSIPTRMTYAFSGKENVNRTGAQTHTTRTRWEGNKLVTEGNVYQITNHGESSWKLKEVRSMTPKGEMVYETAHTDEDGESRTVVRVFRRK